ncbi:hypothetical protein B1H10_07595, partial [candidate division KSB1 bacterium 4484_188]
AFVFIAIFLLSVSWHTRLHAQGGGGLAGRIVDVKTQKALPGVLVKIAELDTSQFSSQPGRWFTKKFFWKKVKRRVRNFISAESR